MIIFKKRCHFFRCHYYEWLQYLSDCNSSLQDGCYAGLLDAHIVKVSKMMQAFQFNIFKGIDEESRSQVRELYSLTFFNRNNVSFEGHFVWSEGLQRFLCKCCLATWQLSGWSNYEIRKNMNSSKIIKNHNLQIMYTYSYPRVRFVRPTFGSTCCENATSQ